MAGVTVTGLVKTFGGRRSVVAVDHLDLQVHDGEFLVLLGPSGCGKTTTLRCIAGLERPVSGRISFDDKVVYDHDQKIHLSADRRDIGMVFQNYALWPHLTVRRNIEYALRARKIKEGLQNDWVGETARLVEIEPYLERLPGQLSGGQQQRVALARGLVARPGVVLLDEPMSNLDAKLREQVRSQLHELHTRLGFTAILVTHDQAEAFALADRVVVMRDGRVEQLGSAREIWRSPASEYVASFVGMTNRLQLTRVSGEWTLNGGRLEGAQLRLPRGAGSAIARLRRGALVVKPAGTAPGDGDVSVPGLFVDATFGGNHLDITAQANDQKLRARIPIGAGAGWIDQLEPGSPVSLHFHRDAASYFANEEGVVAGDGQPAPGRSTDMELESVQSTIARAVP